VAHAIIAIDEGRRVGFLDYMNVRSQIHSAGSDAADILGQAKNAVAVGAPQISEDHQLGNLLGIRSRQADRDQSARNEALEIARLESAVS
jgi:hypothetical protein